MFFSPEIYDTIMEREETWHIYGYLAAYPVSDCSLFDN
jgi:hypothetical protein